MGIGSFAVTPAVRFQVVQYVELFKKPDDEDGGGDGDGSAEDSFTYASDYLGEPDDSEYYTYFYDDDSEYTTWSEGSFCAGVLDNIQYHFSFFFDDTTHSTSTSPVASPSSSYSSSIYSSFSFTGGFHKDTVNGHGTSSAGIAAGAISDEAGVAGAVCHGDELPGCAGSCIPASIVDENLENGMFDLDTFCPTYECDGNGFSYSYCLGDDPVETLHQHGGVAPGAQIAVFDSSYTGEDGYVGADYGGNLVWESAMGTGAKIHSNSWGFDTFCQPTEDDFQYDTFMYEVSHRENISASEPRCPKIVHVCPKLCHEDHRTGNFVRRQSPPFDWSTLRFSSTIKRHLPIPTHPSTCLREQNPKHLLIFAVGNNGGYKDIPTRETCTALSPALGKNSLAVGATSSGPSGGTETGTDGRLIYDRFGLTDYSIEGYPWVCIAPVLGAPSKSAEQADIDAIAWFSSYGPTADGRIKPEVVAPGDQVRQYFVVCMEVESTTR